MAIDELEARVRSRMPLDARVGTRVRAAQALDGHEIEVIYRIDRKGQRVINYFCDGARMSRVILLTLLCPEAAVPASQGGAAALGSVHRQAAAAGARARDAAAPGAADGGSSGRRRRAPLRGSPGFVRVPDTVPDGRPRARAAAQDGLGLVRRRHLGGRRPVDRQAGRHLSAPLRVTCRRAAVARDESGKHLGAAQPLPLSDNGKLAVVRAMRWTASPSGDAPDCGRPQLGPSASPCPCDGDLRKWTVQARRCARASHTRRM